jgi:hypothetical protein
MATRDFTICGGKQYIASLSLLWQDEESQTRAKQRTKVGLLGHSRKISRFRQRKVKNNINTKPNHANLLIGGSEPPEGCQLRDANAVKQCQTELTL